VVYTVSLKVVQKGWKMITEDLPKAPILSVFIGYLNCFICLGTLLCSLSRNFYMMAQKNSEVATLAEKVLPELASSLLLVTTGELV
jgi:hypothetical protein